MSSVFYKINKKFFIFLSVYLRKNGSLRAIASRRIWELRLPLTPKRFIGTKTAGIRQGLTPPWSSPDQLAAAMMRQYVLPRMGGQGFGKVRI
jgi:hypothetical protein